MTRDEIVAEARSWIGTPWHHQGRVKGVGVDCVGVAIGVVRAFGIPVADDRNYPLSPFDHRLQEAIEAHCTRTRIVDVGDLVLFRFLGFPQHVGIDCGATFIHCWQSAGHCAEQYWDNKWRLRVVARYRLPGVTD